MREKLCITSPIPPSVNHYLNMRVVTKRVKGKVVHIPMVYESAEAKKYKTQFKKIVKDAVQEQGWDVDLNEKRHIYIDAYFYFGRIDKDSSNYDKCLLDAITDTGLIWIDDNTALFRPMRVLYDKENPRIELVIYPAEYRGIFADDDELQAFEVRCKDCVRYARNCSLLAGAKVGRIQEEIVGCECMKFKRKKVVSDEY